MNEAQIIEEVGGEFGATVRYRIHENGASVKFFAAQILSRNLPDNLPGYWQKGADSYPCDNDTSFENAERYVEGFVKWDGCSHVSFGDENAQLHICGRHDFDKLTAILTSIYERCGELMNARGTDLLEGEFACDVGVEPSK